MESDDNDEDMKAVSTRKHPVKRTEDTAEDMEEPKLPTLLPEIDVSEQTSESTQEASHMLV